MKSDKNRHCLFINNRPGNFQEHRNESPKQITCGEIEKKTAIRKYHNMPVKFIFIINKLWKIVDTNVRRRI